MDEYDSGTHHSIGYRIGDRRVAPLVSAFVRNMPRRSALSLVTPIGSELKDFLQASGSTKRIRLWVKQHQVDLDTHGSQLVELLQRVEAKRLSVWISVVSESGELLAELEDGNDYLWLRSSIDSSIQSEILADVRNAI